MPQAAVTLYGIQTCDTCRKARRWLETRHMACRYHDLRGDGLDAATLDDWISQLGLEAVLNRRSTTWRALAADLPKDAGADTLRGLMLAHPTLVKRPVVVAGGRATVGFGPHQREAIIRHVGTRLAETKDGTDGGSPDEA